MAFVFIFDTYARTNARTQLGIMITVAEKVHLPRAQPSWAGTAAGMGRAGTTAGTASGFSTVPATLNLYNALQTALRNDCSHFR